MINTQNNDDNQCFKWWLVRYVHPANHHLTRITKGDTHLAKRPLFKDIKFPFKTRNIQKIEKKGFYWQCVSGYGNKVKQYPIYVPKKCCEDKNFELLLIKEDKRHFALIKDFSIFMYDYTLNLGKKIFCRYCLKAFRTSEKLRCHIKYCLKINGKQRIKMQKKLSASD